MNDPTPERPRQVTLAGWLIMVGSVFALGLVVQRLSELHTLENLQRIDTLLAEPPGSDLGVSTDTVITILRTLLMVTAGCATAAAILGYHVLRRSRSARVAVTVLAVPLFLAGLATQGFVTSVVAASAAILWFQPARSWFDGTAPPERRTAPVARPVPPAAAGPMSSSVVPPPPAPAAAPARPPVVLAAAIVTWICSGLVTLGLVASGLVLALSPDLMLDEVHRDNPDLASQGVSDTMLIAATYVMIAGLVLWCIAAAVVAVLVFRRVSWARIVLLVSASVAGVVCLLGLALGAFVLVLPLVAAVFVVVMLVRPDVRPWFDR
ncbi:hypothetical protein [Nocardioides sp. URHA0020]|uniref:hypothetical protein n=1 Tax=Nocardioides sp. URHA0020 TaxID=1380392 RepID=UPI0012DEFA82|nr:hypothetical protein [Nocardioides sp. URHA0020]